LKIQKENAANDMQFMRYLLTGTVHVNEFLIGEYEEGQIGRSSDSKKRIVVAALEIPEKGETDRAYAQR
jgi:hypothetical protein